jgi:rod shape-determining protein MreC
VNERRTALVLFVLLFGQLVLLTAQVPHPESGEPLLEGVALRLLAPLAYGVDRAFRSGAELRELVRTRSRLQDENRRLEDENRTLREEITRLRDVELRLERLAEALDYEPPAAAEIVVADVTYADHASWVRTMVLRLPEEPGDSGSRVKPNATVCTAQGLVGRVVTVAGHYVRVQLITDRASSVGAMIERTRRQGIVRGAQSGLLALHYVPQQADVQIGDRVVTAGIDGVYPRGIPIGTVVEVGEGDDLFHRVRLVPAVDLGVVDQVYVLILDRLPEELKEVRPGALP